MAIGTSANFQIYHEQFFSGVTEVLEQNTELFNAASRNAVKLIVQQKLGFYEQESFVTQVANLITRRNTTSIADVTDLNMAMGQFVGVKVNRKIGPAAQTLDAWRKVGKDPQLMSFLLGQQTAKGIMVDYVETAVNALDAALAGVAALVADVSAASPPTMTHTHLVTGMSKFGDAANRIVCWVMHSKPFFDLMKQAIADKVFEVAGVTIIQGTVATLGKPSIVIDSPSLVVAGTTTKYVTMGLVEGAAEVCESEEREIVSEKVTGKENLAIRVQGEYAMNIRVKGFAWDITNGGANPDDTAVGTSSNWDKASTDNKSLAGIRILSQ